SDWSSDVCSSDLLMKPPRPPCCCCMRRTSRYHTPKNTSAGSTQDSTSRRKVLSYTRVYLTPYLERRSASSGGTRFATATVLPPSFALSLPVMRWSLITTSSMRRSARSFSNSLYGSTSTVCACCHHCCSASMEI